MTTELLGKSKAELTELCVSLGEPAYRGAQIYHALYVERIFEIAQMSNAAGGVAGTIGRMKRGSRCR